MLLKILVSLLMTTTPDLILHNATIHTLDATTPTAQAVALAGDRILYVGDDATALKLKGPKTRVIDLKGATIVPGLTDAHGHVAGLGSAAGRLELVGTGSAAEIARLVSAKAATLKPGQWITGRGWDQNDWSEKSFPKRQMLDEAAPANPVILERVDGHAVWVNTAAIRLAGVTAKTPDPQGGQILREPSGEATGIFVDNAEDLIGSKLPAPTREETREALIAGMRKCQRAGLTQVHDAGVSAESLELYREILVKGDFPFRIYAMLSNDEKLLTSSFQRGPEIGLGNGRLTIRSVKLYVDGALGSRGAALLSPYRDDPANTGLVRTSPDQLEAVATRAAAAGFQVAAHAIGDRGNRIALDMMEKALPKTGDYRFRVEHAQLLAPDDIPRFVKLGIIASMQPTHATSDMYWAEERVGPDRIGGAYAWRKLLNTGARLVCGSDFPVESENPILGFYAAVTRQDLKGWPPGGWQPDQRLTREEALRCFTTEPAWAAFEESSLGMISAGYLADLTVLSRDIMTVPASEIPGTTAVMTVVGGKVAYERE